MPLRCENCCIFRDRHVDRNYQVMSEAVLKAARDGCPGCLLIQDAVDKAWDTCLDRLNDTFYFESFTSQQLSYRAVRLRRQIRTHPGVGNNRTSTGLNKNTELYFAKSSTAPTWHMSRLARWREPDHSGIPNRLQITGPANSYEAIAWARGRLQNCLESHIHCVKPTPTAVRPKRLIWIGLSETHIIRLIDSVPSVVNYTTLSYCWGQSSQHHTLREKNYAQYTTEIPKEALLRTFSDAIYFSRAIGIEYIWIDAFCIIQDRLSDWKEEAEKMCDVYKNSYVTLSALGFSNPDQGLFDQRTDQTVLTRGNCTYFCNVIDEHPLDWLEWPNWWSSFNALPSMSRGWCYQERLLSSRTLHFTRREIYWDCWQEHCCQCTHSDQKVSDASQWHSSALARQKHSLALVSQDPKTLLRRWREVVHEFTLLSLSFASDRLSALHGIAMEFQNINEQKYLFGLWHNTLLQDLCWALNLGFNEYNKVKGHRVPNTPTWSWGSVDGPVRYHTGLTESDEFRHEPLCTLENLDPTSPHVHPAVNKDRTILLFGRRVERELSFFSDNKKFHLSGLPSSSASVNLDYALWSDYDQGYPPDTFPGKFALFGILWVPEGENFGMHCIVLRQIADQRVFPIFQRVGHMHVKGDIHTARSWNKWFAESGTEGYVLLV